NNCTINNSIVYFNLAPDAPNYGFDCTFTNCCTWPLPPAGTGNISLDPQLVGTAHIAATSPCRAAGNPAYATGTDLDGEAWANPPSMGCDELSVGTVTGPIGVSLTLSYTNVPVGYPVDLAAVI